MAIHVVKPRLLVTGDDDDDVDNDHVTSIIIPIS